MSVVGALQRNRATRAIIHSIERRRAESILLQIEPFLKGATSVVDIGAGPCVISEVLMASSYNIVPIDIQDNSFSDMVSPILYNGRRIPFQDDLFDVSLLLQVLHHTANPGAVLEEARRISERIIVLEDVFTNSIGRYTTCLADSLLNFEFEGHPHSNKRDCEWQQLFAQLGLRLIHMHRRRMYGVFNTVLYVLSR
jgi:SAM-dependent methyltransferase